MLDSQILSEAIKARQQNKGITGAMGGAEQQMPNAMAGNGQAQQGGLGGVITSIKDIIAKLQTGA